MDSTLCPARRGAVPDLSAACGRRARRCRRRGIQSPYGCSAVPSGASDFMSCPMLYRFRVIDKLRRRRRRRRPGARSCTPSSSGSSTCPRPSAPSRRAVGLVPQEWARLADEEPAMLDLLAEHDGRTDEWLPELRRCCRRGSASGPRPPRAAERELYVETEIDGLVLRGYVDRLDVAPGGAICAVVDYKTGRSPSEHFEAKALFPDEVLCARALATARCHAQAPAAGLPRQQRDRRLRARRAGPPRHEAQGQGRCGRRSSVQRRPATGGRARAGSATGATTGSVSGLGRHPPPLPRTPRCAP